MGMDQTRTGVCIYMYYVQRPAQMCFPCSALAMLATRTAPGLLRAPPPVSQWDGFDILVNDCYVSDIDK